MGLAGRCRAGRAAGSGPGRPLSQGRRRLRRLGVVVGAATAGCAALAVAPFLVPLPTIRGRPAADLARELGWAGSLVEADGTRAWVQEAGPADGPAVVLVHGFGGSTWSWRATIPALAAAGYRAIAVDLANFGLSDKSWDRDTSHARQADLVDAVMEARGIEAATVVGHSMGADVLAWLAARHPGRVERSVLVDAATGPAGQRGGAGRLAALVGLPPVRRLARLALRSLLDDGRLAAIFRSAWADPSRATADALAGYAAPLRTARWDEGLVAIVRDGGTGRLDAPLADLLSGPTLIAWGREDRWIPLAAGEALRAILPAAEWRIIDDAGHLPMEEQPATFNEILLAWLESTR